MAISKKGKRKITVGKDEFYWIYKFQAESLRLTIMSDEKTNSKLIYHFNCKDYWLNHETRVWNFSPNVIKKAIEFGLSSGWNPLQKGKDFIIKEVEKSFDHFFESEISESILNPKSKI